MFTRFNGNVVPFADDATSTNRTVFGGTTQSDLIDDNLNTNFKKGWEIVGLNDNPTREDFNGMGYTLGALTAYLYEMGISEWNASQNYRANSRVTGSDGKIYKSLTGTTGTPNAGNNPTTDAVNWVAEESVIYSALTAKTTPIDEDLLALGDSTSSFSLKKLSWANIKATLKTYFDTLYVTLSGNQTIADIKTFTSSPIVPTPTAQDNSTKVATTAYVDGKKIFGGIELSSHDEKANRVFGSTYINSNNKPMYLKVVQGLTTSTLSLTINGKLCDIDSVSNLDSSAYTSVSGFVGVMETYKVSVVGTSGGAYIWTESY